LILGFLTRIAAFGIGLWSIFSSEDEPGGGSEATPPPGLLSD
jgi:hypothetical protein